MYSQLNNHYGLYNYNNPPSPPLSIPTSPNDDLRRKDIFEDSNFLKYFSPSTPKQSRHMIPNYFNSNPRLSVKMVLPDTPFERFSVPHNMGDTNADDPHSDAKLSTCNDITLTPVKTTMQTTLKLSTSEIGPNFDHKIHVVGQNHCSRVKSYQKIAPNLKINTNSDDSSSLMKINYLLNSPINSPVLSTFPKSSQRFFPKFSNERKKAISKITNFDKPFSERKRKSNSLARAMQDRGLLKSTLNITSTTFTETKSVLFPTPPTMGINELTKNIEDLNIDMSLLDNANINIKWKGQPLNITNIAHYPLLHPKEAHVTSILRLTPVQYLTSKYILISSARRYAKKNLPFRKSDAQKLLRIDVNKASKLWEVFHQIQWI